MELVFIVKREIFYITLVWKSKPISLWPGLLPLAFSKQQHVYPSHWLSFQETWHVPTRQNSGQIMYKTQDNYCTSRRNLEPLQRRKNNPCSAHQIKNIAPVKEKNLARESERRVSKTYIVRNAARSSWFSVFVPMVMRRQSWQRWTLLRFLTIMPFDTR